ncbi:MAG: hypothetical protein HY904_05785 [Deltaproteobacteria bacterium]|nr:hypothetical protein [Deltaproteobacteria bacterium]
MIPPKADERWSRLVRGDMRHQFRSVPAGLMVSRLNRSLAEAGGHSSMEQCVDQLYEFFQKYERLLKDDITVIFR